MIYYIDYIKKIIYIMAPKCGTTTISTYLKKSLHTKYDNNLLFDKGYLKLVIYRENIIERFISGFYEDLFNNLCYDNMDITFNEYLLFLYNCFKNKISNANSINIDLNKNIPVWWGNCSNIFLPITNNDGSFISHIQSQKYAISKLINSFKDDNIKIIELNNINLLIGSDLKCNVKNKKMYDNVNLFTIKLCELKKNKIIISPNMLNNEQKDIILQIYQEDVDFINELKFKYETFK